VARDERDTEPKPCLIGQPVVLGRKENNPAAALRISASARLVSEAFSSDEELARGNLRRAIEDVGMAVAKIERLLLQMDSIETAGVFHGA
jgi:hypothetical protein